MAKDAKHKQGGSKRKASAGTSDPASQKKLKVEHGAKGAGADKASKYGSTAMQISSPLTYGVCG